MGDVRVERLRALTGSGLGAWREAQTTGGLSETGPRRAALVQGLVRRWQHDLDEQLESVLERESPGHERLRRLLCVWLDLCRATAGVRSAVAAEGVELRAPALLRPLLVEDLGSERAADDLLERAVGVVAAEDLAGRPLRRARRALLASAGRARVAAWRAAWV